MLKNDEWDLPDAPGYCPGPANCPLMQPCEAESRTVKPGAEIKITYLEFDGAHLSYAEWTEDGEEHHAHDVPREVRERLAMSILK